MNFIENNNFCCKFLIRIMLIVFRKKRKRDRISETVLKIIVCPRFSKYNQFLFPVRADYYLIFCTDHNSPIVMVDSILISIQNCCHSVLVGIF